MRTTHILTAALAVLLLLAATAPAAHAVRLGDTAIFFEINDTDGDAGIQLFLDGEGWKRMKLFDPNGRKLLDVRARGAIGFQGITELFFESAEPSFDEQPLEELLALFPEGRYRFDGMTTDGRVIKGRARLTHALPDAPVLVSPEEEEEVDPEDVVIAWEAVADPPGSMIVGYHVVVETDEDDIPLMVFTADLDPTTTSVTVPPEFLLPGTAYKFEVLAIERSGNQTISEREFETE